MNQQRLHATMRYLYTKSTAAGPDIPLPKPEQQEQIQARDETERHPMHHERHTSHRLPAAHEVRHKPHKNQGRADLCPPARARCGEWIHNRHGR